MKNSLFFMWETKTMKNDDLVTHSSAQFTCIVLKLKFHSTQNVIQHSLSASSTAAHHSQISASIYQIYLMQSEHVSDVRCCTTSLSLLLCTIWLATSRVQTRLNAISRKLQLLEVERRVNSSKIHFDYVQLLRRIFICSPSALLLRRKYVCSRLKQWSFLD